MNFDQNMKYVLIDDYFTTHENLLVVHAALFSLLSVSSTDNVFSPTWPDNKPISSYESILVDLVCGLREPAVFVAHSFGSLILELCILKKKIPVSNIKTIIHCSPYFRNKKRDAKLLSFLPSIHVQVPGILKRTHVTDRFWYNSVWARRSPTLDQLIEVNRMMCELTHLEISGNIQRQFYMDMYDEIVSFRIQARFLSRQGFLIVAKNAKQNRHRHIWENHLWLL